MPRWLDIGLVLFLRFYGPLKRKKRTGPISSHLDLTSLIKNIHVGLGGQSNNTEMICFCLGSEVSETPLKHHYHRVTIHGHTKAIETRRINFVGFWLLEFNLCGQEPEIANQCNRLLKTSLSSTDYTRTK